MTTLCQKSYVKTHQPIDTIAVTLKIQAIAIAPLMDIWNLDWHKDLSILQFIQRTAAPLQSGWSIENRYGLKSSAVCKSSHHSMQNSVMFGFKWKIPQLNFNCFWVYLFLVAQKSYTFYSIFFFTFVRILTNGNEWFVDTWIKSLRCVWIFKTRLHDTPLNNRLFLTTYIFRYVLLNWIY